MYRKITQKELNRLVVKLCDSNKFLNYKKRTNLIYREMTQCWSHCPLSVQLGKEIFIKYVCRLWSGCSKGIIRQIRDFLKNIYIFWGVGVRKNRGEKCTECPCSSEKDPEVSSFSQSSHKKWFKKCLNLPERGTLPCSVILLIAIYFGKRRRWWWWWWERSGKQELCLLFLQW